jgi:hypothetical protein
MWAAVRTTQRAADWLCSHLPVASVGYVAVMSYDASTIATLRRALDEVLLDARFHHRKSSSALEVAEHLLARAADGERDLERLKCSACEKLTAIVDHTSAGHL